MRRVRNNLWLLLLLFAWAGCSSGSSSAPADEDLPDLDRENMPDEISDQSEEAEPAEPDEEAGEESPDLDEPESPDRPDETAENEPEADRPEGADPETEESLSDESDEERSPEESDAEEEEAEGEGADEESPEWDSDAPEGETPAHPGGWFQAHRPAAKLQTSDCRVCHGEDLTGGSSGVGCDGCHRSSWRTECTFCHGGLGNQTGAPPVDRRDRTDPSLLSIGGHASHVGLTTHPAYDCTQCHVKPESAASAGHLFDATPGRSEVAFGLGLSSAGAYNPADGTCSGLYCHGNGRGGVGGGVFTGSIDACRACHPGPQDTSPNWEEMTGRHSEHLSRGYRCSDCHKDTASDEGLIGDATKHVNGQIDTRFSGTIKYIGGSCNGYCHERHEDRSW